MVTVVVGLGLTCSREMRGEFKALQSKKCMYGFDLEVYLDFERARELTGPTPRNLVTVVTAAQPLQLTVDVEVTVWR